MNYLGLDKEKTANTVSELNILLADYHLYYQKLRNFHWNVIGKNFFDLHEKFEELYDDAKLKVDEIAERILTLRHHPVSKFSDYIKIATVQEESAMISDQAMIDSLLKDHKIILAQMSSVIDSAENASDEGTVDLIGAYIRELEKTSWMLNAWTKKSTEQLKEDTVAS